MKKTCEHQEECMKMIQMILDGEASQEQIAHFKSHNLEECMPCIESYQQQASLKSLLNNKVEKICCPEKLVAHIKAKIGLTAATCLAILSLIFCHCK